MVSCGESYEEFMNQIVDEAHLTYVELRTVLKRAEAYLYSRSIRAISSVPIDFNHLTSELFSTTAISENNTIKIPIN